jgi:membrane-associated phospholipid phosphatase
MRWEHALVTVLHLARGPVLDALMVALSLSAPVVVLAVAGRRARGAGGAREGFSLAAAAAGAALICVELQFILLRPRPTPTLAGWPAPPTPSFPSGHAALVAALATMALLGRWRGRHAGLVYAAGVAISRVYLGHHHPADVLMGAAVGAAVGGLIHGRLLAQPDLRPGWSWWLWPQAAVVLLGILTATLGLSRFEWLRLPGADKTLHFVLFGLFSLFASGYLRRWGSAKVSATIAVLATLEELSQAFVPTRTFDLGDLACTLSGILAGHLIATRLADPPPTPLPQVQT